MAAMVRLLAMPQQHDLIRHRRLQHTAVGYSDLRFWVAVLGRSLGVYRCGTARKQRGAAAQHQSVGNSNSCSVKRCRGRGGYLTRCIRQSRLHELMLYGKAGGGGVVMTNNF